MQSSPSSAAANGKLSRATKVRDSAPPIEGLFFISAPSWGAETTGFKGDLYADSSRELYRKFGLLSTLRATPSGQTKRSYATSSFFTNVVSSIRVCITQSLAALPE